MFWLIKEVLSSNEIPEEELQPISNREFYLSLSIIALFLAILSLVFGGFAR